MKQFGVVLPNLGYSQLAYTFIKNANDIARHIDVVAFYEELAVPVMQPKFSSTQAVDLWGFVSPVVATTFSTATKLLRVPTVRSKFFYVWDLEWLRFPGTAYRTFYEIYGSPELKLIARSLDHKLLLEQLWNRPVAGVVADFESEALLGLLS